MTPGEPLPAPPVGMQLDIGIRETVELLRANGVETYESCEGGAGHAYHEPTICFHGTPEAGWRCLALCLAYGRPVAELRRFWRMQDGHEPEGPSWAITFRRRPG